jgi:hypothetical protein
MFDLGLTNSSQAGFWAGVSRMKTRSKKSLKSDEKRRARNKSGGSALYPRKAVNVGNTGVQALATGVATVLPLVGVHVEPGRMGTAL